MKKLVAILLVAILIFGAVGCGSSEAAATATNKTENSNVSNNTEKKNETKPSNDSKNTTSNKFEFSSKDEAFDAMVKYRDTFVEMLVEKADDADSNMMLASKTDDEIKRIMYDWAVEVCNDLDVYYSDLESYVGGYLRAVAKDISEYEDDLEKLRDFLDVGGERDTLYEDVYHEYTWKFFDRLFNIYSADPDFNGEPDEDSNKIDEAFTEIMMKMYDKTELIEDRIDYIEEQFAKGNADIDKYLK